MGWAVKVEMRFSKDGGYTWSDWHARDIGETGDFMQPAIWRRLGISRQWIIHVRMTTGADLLASSIQAQEAGA